MKAIVRNLLLSAVVAAGGGEVAAATPARMRPAADTGCSVIADVPEELRTRLQDACADGLRRMKAKFGVTTDPVPVWIRVVGASGPGADEAPLYFTIRLWQREGVAEALDNGLIHHELGHLAVFQWLSREGLPVAHEGGYSTRLPDVLDDGLAILAQPNETRSVYRYWLPRLKVPRLRELWDLEHPSLTGPPSVTRVKATTRETYTPCAECGPPFHDSKWVVIEQRVHVDSVGNQTTTVDTTYAAERPREREVSSTTRFYTLSDALIEFLDEQFSAPARLRQFVLGVARMPAGDRHGVAIVRQLARSLGRTPAALEAQWADWVRQASQQSP